MNKNDDFLLRNPGITHSVAGNDSVVIQIEATHAGFVNGNNVLYTTDGMSTSTGEWTEPFNKPVLTHHNALSDALGRVTDATYVDTDLTMQDSGVPKTKNKPKGHILLSARITDPDAIPKVRDGRYSTVSISGSTNKVRCGLCSHDIANKGPCPSHKKGKVYDGKKAHWIIDGMNYSEVSFVNVPADKHAKITQVIVNDSTTGSNVPVKSKDNADTTVKKEDKMENDIVFPSNDVKFFEALYKTERNAFGDLGNLHDSAFAGPSRTFIANDDTNVKSSLAKLSQVRGLSPSTRSRIRASLVRRAKKFGVQVDKRDEELAKQISLKDPWTVTQTQESTKAWEEITNRDAKLTSAARKALPSSAFCGPDRSFPAHDRSHAVNALARVKQFGSSALQSRVRACVCRKFSGLPSCKTGGQKDWEKIDITEVWSDELVHEVQMIDRNYPEDALIKKEFVDRLPDICFSGPNRTFLSYDLKTATASLGKAKSHGSEDLYKQVAARILDKFPDMEMGEFKIEGLDKVKIQEKWEDALVEEASKIEKEYGTVLSSDKEKVNYDSMISKLDHVKIAKDFLESYDGKEDKKKIKEYLEQKEEELSDDKPSIKSDKGTSGNGVEDKDGEESMTLEEMLKTSEMVGHLKTLTTPLQDEVSDQKKTIKSLQDQVTGLLEDNTELRDSFHNQIVNKIFDLKVKLKKKDVAKLDDKATAQYKDKLLERTDESLKDTLADLQADVKDETPTPKGTVEPDGIHRQDDTNKSTSKQPDVKKKSASDIILGK